MLYNILRGDFMYEVVYYSDNGKNPVLNFLLTLSDNKFVFLHAIRKTTQKTPKKDITLALKRQINYIKGCDDNES